MRVFGALIALFGFLLFIFALSFQQLMESKATLCQIVEGEKLIGRPVKLLLDQNAVFIKGTGPENSRFIDRSGGPYRSIEALSPLFLMAKIGGLIVIAMGVVGFQFEKWRHHTGAILTGRPPDL